MNNLMKMSFLSLIVIISFCGCKKAEEDTAQIAKETITEIKENTIDAAKAAATVTEQAAKDIAKAAEQADADVTAAGAEATDK